MDGAQQGREARRGRGAERGGQRVAPRDRGLAPDAFEAWVGERFRDLGYEMQVTPYRAVVAADPLAMRGGHAALELMGEAIRCGAVSRHPSIVALPAGAARRGVRTGPARWNGSVAPENLPSGRGAG
jgi:hypothetical protein